ncbi:MAG: hypothetical protein WKG07_09860 [Hymenobacter sp.]
MKHINPVLNLFMPELQIADNSHLDGSFRQDETSILQLGGKFDSLWYGPVRTAGTEFDFTTSKLPYQPEVLAQASVTSDRQVLPGLGRTEKFVVEGVWDQQRINFSTSLAQTRHHQPGRHQRGAGLSAECRGGGFSQERAASTGPGLRDWGR